MPLRRMKMFTTSRKGHKVASRLSHQWFTPSFNACLLKLTDVFDTASRANQRILSEWLRKISFRVLTDPARFVLKDRENILHALREKPLKVYEVMKRANVMNEEA